MSITRIQHGSTVVASYTYLGAGSLVGVTLDEAGVFSRSYNSGNAYTDHMDRFGRVIKSAWTKDLSTDRDFYDVRPTWDTGSGITTITDEVLTTGAGGTGNGLFDAFYAMDRLKRVTGAREGHWNGSSISTVARDELWTLTQLGNWSNRKLDLDGDLNYNEASELDDTGTFNGINELTERNTNSSGWVEHTLTYNKRGDLTDDGEDYTYIYDAFGRLREVKTRGGSPVLVEEHRYNGLGQRIAWHFDFDADSTVENTADDPWMYAVHDDAWRVVEVFEGSDTEPTEQFTYHNAGLVRSGRFGAGASTWFDRFSVWWWGTW